MNFRRAAIPRRNSQARKSGPGGGSLSTRNEKVDKRLTVKDKARVVSRSFKLLHMPHDQFSANLAFRCVPSRDVRMSLFACLRAPETQRRNCLMPGIPSGNT